MMAGCFKSGDTQSCDLRLKKSYNYMVLFKIEDVDDQGECLFHRL